MNEQFVKVKGAFHLQIVEDGVVVGDSGVIENQVVNLGFNDYLVRALGSIAGSKYITHVALGTGGAPAAADTSLAGEVEKRQTVTAATSSTSKVLQLTATFNSGLSFVTNTQNISNIGLFNTSAGGSLFAGNAFASSSVGTNQNVNVTYTISFT